MQTLLRNLCLGVVSPRTKFRDLLGGHLLPQGLGEGATLKAIDQQRVSSLIYKISSAIYGVQTQSSESLAYTGFWVAQSAACHPRAYAILSNLIDQNDPNFVSHC